MALCPDVSAQLLLASEDSPPDPGCHCRMENYISYLSKDSMGVMSAANFRNPGSPRITPPIAGCHAGRETEGEEGEEGDGEE